MTWYEIEHATQTISNGRLSYQYGAGYLHNGHGVSITRFTDLVSGQNFAYGLDGQYKGEAWDAEPISIGEPQAAANYVEIPIESGQTRKRDRLYRDAPILEIAYQRNDADWTEDFVYVPGAEEEIAFVMYGMDDVIGQTQGKALWDAAEAQFGHNYGNHFLTVNGSSVARCTIHGHYVYGFINRTTGCGLGMVYPTWITTREWKVWWTERNKIEIEYAPHGQTGTRWLFAVTGGKEEVMACGTQLAQFGTWPTFPN